MAEEMQVTLKASYKPQPKDILSGRSRESYNHDGNHEFRGIIALRLPHYLSLTTRKERQALIASVLQEIVSDGGHFLERKDNRWVTLTKAQAHRKVGHALRDAALRESIRTSRNEKTDCTMGGKGWEDRSSKRQKMEVFDRNYSGLILAGTKYRRPPTTSFDSARLSMS